MMTASKAYTTQLQAGLGMIPETLALLQVWEPGMSATTLEGKAIAEGIFARTTARRTRNLVLEMFAPRYLADSGATATRLKGLLARRAPDEVLRQLFFLFTARAQAILADFVTEIYWPKYSGGAQHLTKADAEAFILRALDEGRMASRWSEETIFRVSGYLLGCCIDFGLLGEGTRVQRPIQRFALRPEAALYLAHDLHFARVGDMALVAHPDWQLFGLLRQEVIQLLGTIGRDGHLIIQSSGELVQISWKYETMEECLDAIARR